VPQESESTMKIVKWLAASLVLCLAGTGSVWADRGHHDHGRHGGNIRFGVVVGPYWGPWFYPPAPYYYPPYYPPVVVQRRATVIEQPAAPAPQTNYWYYCNTSGLVPARQGMSRRLAAGVAAAAGQP
jgi:hypothetical protein